MLHNPHLKPMLAIALALCATAAPAATARPITTGPACSACEYGPLVDFARVHAPAGVAATVRLVSPRGFDWGDAGIGGAAGVALAFVAFGGTLAILQRQRRRTRRSTAALG